ncbi:hypothetical protein A2533_00650 [Candidatus Falkowbacteria bacterium RIFOXYD2_FULL_35_9]|uniref:SHOCT domain-containing protein n=1 Tax=Candidatus Falkowbacteria bacterium RIFOXYC2_FULL_36_12 TaxID=1798002 RepID=A0A1F5T0F6_9BACT|nr:MAG: hypothetical protein A2300_00020 [Candidatus Falkowbacteria bacterium RIFOXYB2_FULL_35_7]OGF32444.1 MAG: hypothetical protein A2478_03835 [Candidatus Falkowbacteria bacterium RIFOXYC2_FULL_36_12]OGF46784.1 MAG: hypothetical protein A2533_00650 [Candidatus Falkowbacteria bacterium RIFOXYD2_FULL_35_9]
MMGFGYYPFGWLSMGIFWLVLIIGVVFLIKWLMEQGKNGKTTSNSAREILDERYAKGEINKHEYEEKKQDLS